MSSRKVNDDYNLFKCDTFVVVKARRGLHMCVLAFFQGRRVSFPRKSSVDGPEHRRRSRLSSVWDLQSSLKSEFGIDDNVVYRYKQSDLMTKQECTELLRIKVNLAPGNCKIFKMFKSSE